MNDLNGYVDWFGNTKATINLAINLVISAALGILWNWAVSPTGTPWHDIVAKTLPVVMALLFGKLSKSASTIAAEDRAVKLK